MKSSIDLLPGEAATREFSGQIPAGDRRRKTLNSVDQTIWPVILDLPDAANTKGLGWRVQFRIDVDLICGEKVIEIFKAFLIGYQCLA
ncbi:hypothetical protein ACOJBO_12460 [Rhizobium beringeri]